MGFSKLETGYPLPCTEASYWGGRVGGETLPDVVSTFGPFLLPKDPPEAPEDHGPYQQAPVSLLFLFSEEVCFPGGSSGKEFACSTGDK